MEEADFATEAERSRIRRWLSAIRTWRRETRLAVGGGLVGSVATGVPMAIWMGGSLLLQGTGGGPWLLPAVVIYLLASAVGACLGAAAGVILESSLRSATDRFWCRFEGDAHLRIDSLLRVVGSEMPYLRRRASTDLGRLGGRAARALPALEAAEEDPDLLVVREARRAARRIADACPLWIHVLIWLT